MSADEPATPDAPEPEAPAPAPAPTPEALLQDRCAACHGLDRLDSDIAVDRWPAIVDEMIQKGAKLDEAEKQIVLDHLTSG
jgi:mono/diheme cytochrome c family protein